MQKHSWKITSKKWFFLYKFFCSLERKYHKCHTVLTLLLLLFIYNTWYYKSHIFFPKIKQLQKWVLLFHMLYLSSIQNWNSPRHVLIPFWTHSILSFDCACSIIQEKSKSYIFRFNFQTACDHCQNLHMCFVLFFMISCYQLIITIKLISRLLLCCCVVMSVDFLVWIAVEASLFFISWFFKWQLSFHFTWNKVQVIAYIQFDSLSISSVDSLHIIRWLTDLLTVKPLLLISWFIC